MMKQFQFLLFIILISSVGSLQAQKVIPLYEGKAPGSETWTWQEQESDHNMFNTPVVYNVVNPTLTVFLPPASSANGTAIIIAPGGGFHTLSINSEGTDVAKWLNAKGVTAFVLKYRLVHSLTDDPVKELMSKLTGDRNKLNQENDSVIKLAIDDGKKAVEYVRSHANEYGIDPNRIGFMGFSAGGTVTMGVGLTYTADNRPDFLAPIYAYMGALEKAAVPKDAPPIFICAATDDQLGLASHSSNLYNNWLAAGKPAELHMYEKGGHGFGMRQQNLPTDSWIERFGDWLDVNGLLWPAHPTGSFAQTTPQQAKQWRKNEEERLHMDWANRKRFENENKMLVPAKSGEKRVVFMGNSITEGWYRYDSSYFLTNNYIDRGISGQTTSQMLVRFRQDVINLKPSVVVILAGTNDIAQNTGPITLEEIAGNIASMAELAKANGIQVVLCSVLPAAEYPWRPGMGPAEKIPALNKLIKAYAEKNNITYADLFSAMEDGQNGMKKELATDGVHPNLEGYKIMEPLVAKAIAETLKKKRA